MAFSGSANIADQYEQPSVDPLSTTICAPSSDEAHNSAAIIVPVKEEMVDPEQLRHNTSMEVTQEVEGELIFTESLPIAAILIQNASFEIDHNFIVEPVSPEKKRIKLEMYNRSLVSYPSVDQSMDIDQTNESIIMLSVPAKHEPIGNAQDIVIQSPPSKMDDSHFIHVAPPSFLKHELKNEIETISLISDEEDIITSEAEEFLPIPPNHECVSDQDRQDLWEELTHKLDLQEYSQRIQDEDSDTDQDTLADNQAVLPEERNLSGRHWDDDFTQLMRHCGGAGVTKTQSSGYENAGPSQVLSSQMIDIELAELDLEMATTAEDWMQPEYQTHENKTDENAPSTDATDINFELNVTQCFVLEKQQSVRQPSIRNRKSYNDPFPLFVDDVLLLLKGPWNRKFYRFGFTFQQIALYGRCIPMGCATGAQPNTTKRKYYEVDDGTACVRVLYDHMSRDRKQLHRDIQQLDKSVKDQR